MRRSQPLKPGAVLGEFALNRFGFTFERRSDAGRIVVTLRDGEVPCECKAYDRAPAGHECKPNAFLVLREALRFATAIVAKIERRTAERLATVS